MRVGSQEHRDLFCGLFLSTHEAWEPGGLPWPDLDARSLALLQSIPVWSTALQVEVNAGAMIAGFADTRQDALIVEALRLQGREEDRHGRMIATMSERYGLSASAVAPSSPPTQAAFIDFGCSECLDSLLGFGVFRIAREREFMPEALTALFARVLREEARHIVFFVNWAAYEKAQRPSRLGAASTALGYGRALWRTLGRASGSRIEDKGLEAVGDLLEDLTAAEFLQACLDENALHMAAFDPQLLRPTVMPALARAALRVAESGARARRLVRREPQARPVGVP